jgi:hypothetical protein
MRTILLHEPVTPRRQLYVRHFSRLGFRVATDTEERHDVAVVSLPDAEPERGRALHMLKQISGQAPVIVFDLKAYDGSEFDGIPLLSHMRRDETPLREVMSRIRALLL